MNAVLLNKNALTGFKTTDALMNALIQYYEVNLQPDMAVICRAWAKVKGIPVK